ncbi:MAG: hypothetical protein Ct9H90mP3_4720 [Flammeovirgaceae bacterium]|nr:MAG: hypothetical protein Ct9H90mP3_4720 [Flammeovirgaceae bacterium]
MKLSLHKIIKFIKNLLMNLTITSIIGIFFLMWMVYFFLGAFANMTENKTLLKIFKSFKYIIGVISIIFIILYIFY